MFSLIYCISNYDSSRDLSNFIISSISSFEIINAYVTDPKILLWIATFVADASAVNPNGIKTFLANSVSKFFINGKPAVINGQKKFEKSSFRTSNFSSSFFQYGSFIFWRLNDFLISFTLLFVRVTP